MKIYFIILLSFLPIFLFGQKFNEITEQEYGNIKFDGIPLTTLIAFEGDVKDISQLFNLNFTNTSNDIVGEAKDFSHPDISLSYLGLIPRMQIGRITIKTSNITVKFLDEEIHIGDNISLLELKYPDFKYHETSDADTYWASFQPELYSSFIWFEFDASGTIISIEYMSLT